MESTNEASCFIFSSLKYFRGYRLSTKIFYSKFFYNEIDSNENFPDYGTLPISMMQLFFCYVPRYVMCPLFLYSL